METNFLEKIIIRFKKRKEEEYQYKFFTCFIYLFFYEILKKKFYIKK